MAYLELIDGKYTRLRKELLKSKGSPLQKEFLQVARESKTFISWIEELVGVEDKSIDVPFDQLWTEPLSDHEFKEPTVIVEENLYKKWSDLTPSQASRETFWGHVTLMHVEEGIIKASYLAANGGSLPGGLERIDKVLDDDQETAIDSTVRTILRRLSGLPERGSRSVYANCPFARAWWRGYVADQVCDATKADHKKVVKTLRKSQEYWERLIVLIVSQNSVLGDTNVRTALIWALSELVDNDKNTDLFKVGTLSEISRKIGIRSAWQELGVFSIDELKSIMDQQILQAIT